MSTHSFQERRRGETEHDATLNISLTQSGSGQWAVRWWKVFVVLCERSLQLRRTWLVLSPHMFSFVCSCTQFCRTVCVIAELCLLICWSDDSARRKKRFQRTRLSFTSSLSLFSLNYGAGTFPTAAGYSHALLEYCQFPPNNKKKNNLPFKITFLYSVWLHQIACSSGCCCCCIRLASRFDKQLVVCALVSDKHIRLLFILV